jgi:hypothetical protein
VSVAFQVASDFRDYASGVYSSTVCKNGAMDVNHAVLAVGYGTDPVSNMTYWTIKNSWDYSWGDEGFSRWSRSSTCAASRTATRTRTSTAREEGAARSCAAADDERATRRCARRCVCRGRRPRGVERARAAAAERAAARRSTDDRRAAHVDNVKRRNAAHSYT